MAVGAFGGSLLCSACASAAGEARKDAGLSVDDGVPLRRAVSASLGSSESGMSTARANDKEQKERRRAAGAARVRSAALAARVRSSGRQELGGRERSASAVTHTSTTMSRSRSQTVVRKLSRAPTLGEVTDGARPRSQSVSAAARQISRSVESQARLVEALHGLHLHGHPGVFDNFALQCRCLMSLRDVEEASLRPDREHRTLYFGVCLSGVCVHRLAACFVDFLRRSFPSMKDPHKHVQNLVLDKLKISFRLTVTELVQLLVMYGGEGFGPFTILLGRPDTLPLLMDLARSQVLCNSREHIVEQEERSGHAGLQAEGHLFKQSHRPAFSTPSTPFSA